MFNRKVQLTTIAIVKISMDELKYVAPYIIVRIYMHIEIRISKALIE